VSAGARRRDNIPRGLFEYFDRVFRDGARIFAEPCVEGRLSAAGLLAGEVHTNAEAVENVHDRLTRLREERINETGDEELDCNHDFILIPKYGLC